jgi:sulfide:quinone oxidoreductase
MTSRPSRKSRRPPAPPVSRLTLHARRPRPVADEDAGRFDEALSDLPGPVLAYCRTGTRSTTLWALGRGRAGHATADILAATKAAGYDMSGVVRRIANGGKTPTDVADFSHDIVIIGGGSAGIAVASSLLARASDLDIAIIDPQTCITISPAGRWSAAAFSSPKSRPAPWGR